MNRIVDIEGVPHDVAPLNRAAIESLYESGVLQAMGKVELIDGVLVRMSPSQSPHGVALAAMIAFLLPPLRGRYLVGTDIGVFLQETTMRAPDIAVFDRQAGGGFLDAGDLVLALEIADSSLGRDMSLKAAEYAAHGIPEYWVLDIERRVMHVHRAPSAKAYAETVTHGWSEPLAPLCAPDLQLILSEIFDGVL